MNRRKFLQSSSYASASLMLPSFLKAINHSTLNNANHGRKLVVIQLSGGNDGLNTIIPYRNDHYYSLRPSLSIDGNDAISLSKELAVNPAMEGFAELYDQGLVSIINNVGYPNPNRSHFRSMEIWHTASNANQYLSSGWLGRYLDASCTGSDCDMHKIIAINDSLDLALKGEQKKGMAISDAKSLYKITSTPFIKSLSEHTHIHGDENVDYLNKTMIETIASSEYIYEHSKIYQSKQNYPMNKFGKKLKNIAELINSGVNTSVFYVSLGGFDTHVNQKNQQARLLKMYADSLNAFVQDLKSNNRLDETLIMTFSEFGRRVKQNASNGTDHGTANNVFITGGNLKKAGIYNDTPNLVDLDNGDLKYQIDFRSIYSSILDKWLEVNSQRILGQNFKQLNFI